MTNNIEYDGILFFAQSLPTRIISGPRLRTAAAQNGYNLLIIDYAYSLSEEEILQCITKALTNKTKIIGFSTVWAYDSETGKKLEKILNKDFFDRIKSLFPNQVIITGNQYDTHFNNFSDYHFYGHSELTLVELLKKLDGKEFDLFAQRSLGSKTKIIYSPDVPINNIMTEYIVEDDISSYEPLPIEISRGCIFKCAYCRHPNLGKKNFDEYQRNVQDIANELKRNYDLFGTSRYLILDDTFNDSIEKLNRVRKAVELAKLPKFEFCAYIRPEMLVTKPEMITMLCEMGLRGGHVGIESFNNQNRKVIGRGMDINKVLDACNKLTTQNNKVSLLATFIMGLPHDTEESIIKNHEFLHNEQLNLFKSWVYFPLDIRKKNSFEYDSTVSDFEKDYEKYGYHFNENGWVSSHMNLPRCMELWKTLRKQYDDKMLLGGWDIGAAWITNITELELSTGNRLEILKRADSVRTEKNRIRFNNLLK